MTSQEKRIEETPDQQIERIVEEFRDYRDELLECNPEQDGEDGITCYFGYKTQRGNELFTVPDWGHIEKFIRDKFTSFAAERDEAVRGKYQELLYAVENKYEGETRHDTALRFIKNAQASSSEASATPPPTNPTSDTTVLPRSDNNDV